MERKKEKYNIPSREVKFTSLWKINICVSYMFRVVSVLTSYHSDHMITLVVTMLASEYEFLGLEPWL